MSASKPHRKKRPATPRGPQPAPFGGSERSGPWHMSGCGDPHLWKDYGLTEGEVAMMAIEAVAYAEAKAEGDPVCFVDELTTEFCVALQERLRVDLCPEVPAPIAG